MGHVGPPSIGQIRILGHHVGHRASFEDRELLFLYRGLHTLFDFGFGLSSQYQFCPHQSDWQHSSRGGRIEAERASSLRTPKLRTVEWVHPSAFYSADEAILAFHGRFIAVFSEDHNCRIAGNRWRSRAPPQRDLGSSVHKILV